MKLLRVNDTTRDVVLSKGSTPFHPCYDYSQPVSTDHHDPLQEPEGSISMLPGLLFLLYLNKVSHFSYCVGDMFVFLFCDTSVRSVSYLFIYSTITILIECLMCS